MDIDISNLMKGELEELQERIEDQLSRMDVPKFVPNPDLSQLEDELKGHIIMLAAGNAREDDDHYIYESVMETYFGPGIWNWVNKMV